MRILLALLLMLSISCLAAERSSAQREAFKRTHPCPVKSAYKRCPGYVVDHIIPLCAGGPDKPSNMQWQSVKDAKAKDKLERKQCRRKR